MKLLVAVFLFFGIGANAQNFVLFNKGKSDYYIYSPSGADDIEKNAATEFQRLFKLATGITLPVTNIKSGNRKLILIGKSSRFANFPTVAEDGIILRSDSRNIYISGGSRKGVLYSVYDFMEKYLGYRYYALDEVVYSSKNALPLPANLNYTYSPPFDFRSVYAL